ncbi:hypothetical protein [Haloarchaeobius sp. TZWSO28]|uniref:hypothetical protein n=1 Tax=unclassified Haloarchaeobius TaxID=2614452 RepID=UPI003EB90715
MDGFPIEGQVLLVTAAKASVPPNRLPELVDLVQADLRLRADDYRVSYECIHDDEKYAAFFVESGHWVDIGRRLGFDRRDYEAVQRAHTEQLMRLGRETDRREEFDAALDIRECVLIGKDSYESVEAAETAEAADRRGHSTQS